MYEQYKKTDFKKQDTACGTGFILLKIEISSYEQAVNLGVT
jgi:hypothetical protein